MPDYVYLNGEFILRNNARVSIDDRGFIFGDGVYEVFAVHGSVMIDSVPHLKRLERSLQEVEISKPVLSQDLRSVIRELMTKNKLDNGTVYIQITRGVAPRVHKFPQPPVKPTLLIMTNPSQYPESEDVAFTAIKAITLPDIRWGRCDIKSTSLLANCLAREQADKAGAYEAIMFDQNNMITECSAANAWIITQDGQLRTRHCDNGILSGISRNLTSELAREEGLSLQEEAFSLDEMMKAEEVFLTTTTPMIKSIGRINDNLIGNGDIGPVTRKLLTKCRERVFAIVKAGVDT